MHKLSLERLENGLRLLELEAFTIGQSLKIVFSYEQEAAEAITMKIHEEGSAIVATLPYEMAEQKGVEVTLLARNNGFPLAVKLEPSL